MARPHSHVILSGVAAKDLVPALPFTKTTRSFGPSALRMTGYRPSARFHRQALAQARSASTGYDDRVINPDINQDRRQEVPACRVSQCVASFQSF